MFLKCLDLFLTFLKIGAISFGGGYAMLSMIMTESSRFSISGAQLADLNALDMVVPGAIAINAATYVGYLYGGVPGAVAATLGVSVPSFVLTALFMRFLARFKDSFWLKDILSGIRPAVVGLIAAAVAMIASEVLLEPGYGLAQVLTDPLNALSPVCVALFAATAFCSIRFKWNPILLTVAAGVAGAFLLK
ncbi:MAG: Chromate transport protein [Firmicutes bacterium ADurb.Bin248]|nr:MAG: Chromate transport protein [Firmicutes bacterium ADurb.Bin248]HOG01081.1 chromate transporter [Clostridia bacterium]HPK14955.1 chromate transporter [Clostridia bacterium]